MTRTDVYDLLYYDGGLRSRTPLIYLDDPPHVSRSEDKMTPFTRQNRIDIGFVGDPEDWKTADAIFGEGTLRICGQPVMEDWETPYMRELARIATRNGGAILEVGFGLGISAHFVQNQEIDEHVIIEANAAVFERLHRFSRTARRKVTPIFGFWQEVISSIPPETMDGILFDTYPLTVEEIHCNHFTFFAHAHRLLKPGGILTYYSDEVSEFSPQHVAALRAAGFSQMDYFICQVTPPPDCQYWIYDTIVAPIVVKS